MRVARMETGMYVLNRREDVGEDSDHRYKSGRSRMTQPRSELEGRHVDWKMRRST